MLLTTLDISAESFETATGWAAEPEGMCKGDACVPVPDAISTDGAFDVTAVADRLGMALVADDEAGVWEAVRLTCPCGRHSTKNSNRSV